MDPARGLCLGCARTLDEIARWGAMTDAERDRVLKELPYRKFGDGARTNPGSVPEFGA